MPVLLQVEIQQHAKSAASYNNNRTSGSNGLPAQQKITCKVCKGKGGTTTHETFYGGRKVNQTGKTIYGETTKSSCTYCGGKGYVMV
ncbi:MAG: hypothetical protein WKF35_11100 [Ferruginibacter sp.]